MIVGVTDNFTNTSEVICYPNPFSTVTYVKFNLEDHSLVKATLYDLNGKQIKSIDNNYMNPGTHNIQVSSDGLKNGVYFLKLDLNNYVKVLKLSIVK